MRMEEALAVGKQSTGKDTPEQQQLVGDLARQIQSEPDPLVREAIVKSVSRFQTPLAAQVLSAGLKDTDPLVRRRCCQLIGERSEASQAAALASVLQSDSDLDVKIEAVRALGHIQSPETTAALIGALESEDPALQFAGVESMKKVSGKDYGGDVRAYLAYAKGETPVSDQENQTSVASRLRRFSPF
jgi:HEAT repeat protein